jgi:hypothetical protein
MQYIEVSFNHLSVETKTQQLLPLLQICLQNGHLQDPLMPIHIPMVEFIKDLHNKPSSDDTVHDNLEDDWGRLVKLAPAATA